jgi:ATP-dependent Lon protease
MEIIQLSGYTEFEKVNIARRYLIARQKKECGLDQVELTMGENAIRTVIHHYTKESGVRSLEREIGSICRKVALKHVKSGGERRVEILASDVPNYLGVPKYRLDKHEETDEVGLTHGLSVSDYGGDILDCEVTILPGRGKLRITGLLEKGMNESGHAAISYVRSRAAVLQLETDFYQQHDIHVHFPDFVRKDGPSAGVTMATSVASALTRIPVRHDLAMTGEITLRGRVMPIGGVKEKLLAAQRGGMKTVIIPKDNRKDLRDVPQRILKSLRVILVDHMDDVLRHALVLDNPSKYFGERRLTLEYRNGELFEGEGADPVTTRVPVPLVGDDLGDHPGVTQ